MPYVPTVAERIAMLRRAGRLPAGTPLPPPEYSHDPLSTARVFCGIESFSRHTSDEGWQLQEGLRCAGYTLAGSNLSHDSTDLNSIVNDLNPGTLILQDKREWDPSNDACIAKSEAFTGYECLPHQSDIFRLTIVKDAHAGPPDYFRQASDEIGCHAWIVYYHQNIVCALAPWIRREHVIRTWHSLDKDAVPKFSVSSTDRDHFCLLSGAVNRELYPFRKRLWDAARANQLKSTIAISHPGYHARGTCTPMYLKLLSRFRVAICTASVFGYSLRKLIESTACGCRVITDLPPDEVLPGGIDGNLVRVPPDIDIAEMGQIINHEIDRYDADRQQEFARLAIDWYDWRRRGVELAEAIEAMRAGYGKRAATC